MPDSASQAAGQGALHYDSAGARVSDPTPLTTQQLLRENLWLRELIEARIRGLEVRMEAGDEAVRLLQAFADRTPTTMDVQHAVEKLREVAFVKFDGIRTQLQERDAAMEKASKDVKSAVDAAFAAAKEAVGEQNKSNAAAIDKSEKAFTKQVDGLSDIIKTTAKGVDDKINDIKERITVIESKTSVSDPSSAIAIAELKASVHRLSSTTDISAGRGAGMAALWALIVGGMGFVFALVSVVIVILKFVN